MKNSFIDAVWRYRIWIVCSVISAVVFFFCAFIAHSYRDNLKDHYRRETSNVAKLLIDQFDTAVTSIDDMLLQISSEYPSIETNGSETLKQFHELLRRNALWKSFSNITVGITDKTGMVVATNTQYPFRPLDFSNMKFFTVHASNYNHAKLYISTPQLGTITHKQVIFFSLPLRTKNSAFDGVVLASYPVSDFLRTFNQLAP